MKIKIFLLCVVFFVQSKIIFASESNVHDYAINLHLNKIYALLEESPNDPIILYNYACALRSLNHLSSALFYFEKAISKAPDNDPSDINKKIMEFELARTQLLNGDLINGFQGYEKRREHPETIEKEKAFTKKKLWDGYSSLDNKTILVFGEKGFGDTYQFVRYLPMLKQFKNVRIIAAVQSPLKKIMSLCSYIDKVITLKDKVVPDHDYYAPLMSLPAILGTRIGSIPCTNEAYLTADHNITSYWSVRLASNKNYKIGICGQGNNFYFDNPYIGNIPTNRSIALAKIIQSLSKIPDITLYCLQQLTDEERESDNIKGKIVLLDDDKRLGFDKQFGAFMDTAAVIKNLRLVLIVDTAVAHLAAGLGVKTVILLPQEADWRWMTGRDDSPWYSSVTLIRQDNPDDWDSALAKLSNHVTRLIENEQQ